MKRGERPRLVLVPNPVGETGVLGAEGGAPPLRNASPRATPTGPLTPVGGPASRPGRSADPAPDELAEAAEALAALLRGLAPAGSAGRTRDEDPSA